MALCRHSTTLTLATSRGGWWTGLLALLCFSSHHQSIRSPAQQEMIEAQKSRCARGSRPFLQPTPLRPRPMPCTTTPRAWPRPQPQRKPPFSWGRSAELWPDQNLIPVRSLQFSTSRAEHMYCILRWRGGSAHPVQIHSHPCGRSSSLPEDLLGQRLNAWTSCRHIQAITRQDLPSMVVLGGAPTWQLWTFKWTSIRFQSTEWYLPSATLNSKDPAFHKALGWKR